MSEETGAAYMVAPTTDGRPSLPKRSGVKTMLPSTWIGRSVRIEYTDCHGVGVEASGTLLDLYPAGPVFNLSGARTLVCWERLAVLELAED